VLRVVVFLSLAAIVASTSTAGLGSTFAYFTASAASAANTMSTVHLDVSTVPSVSSVFNIASNMLPGDFQVQTIDVANSGTLGTTQQDFTYAFDSTSVGAGTTCSLLDSSDPPTCSTPAAPSATAGTAAALLLLRCTSDAAATVPLACSTQNVYVTQVYPAAGAGTQQQITAAGGLSRAAITGVATGGSYSISVGGTSFTGGALRIGSPFGLGGPDAISGADGQTRGLSASHTDHLASVVYLPTQAGASLANQTSQLSFTWLATQRTGGTR
jgi:hypothetical protein